MIDNFKDAAGILTSIGAVIAGLLGVFRYFSYKTRRDKILQVRDAFDTVVKSLSSDVEVERLAGAILLRPGIHVIVRLRLPYAADSSFIEATIVSVYSVV